MNYESSKKISEKFRHGFFHNSCFPARTYRRPRQNDPVGLAFGTGGLIPSSFEKGFALLFAILASTVLLSISVAIVNVALREVLLSSFGRESQAAFYAADTGLECALYWDIKNRVFATSTDTNSIPAKRNCPIFFPVSITCDGNSAININVDSCDNNNATSSFSISNTARDICTYVTVTKTDPDGDGTSATKIDARGHNSCSSSPTYVERGLRTTY